MENNEQLALKKSLYSARKTILFQFGTAVLTLLLGLTIIYLFTKWAGTWNARYSDNSSNDFWVDAFMAFIGLIFLIYYTLHEQFENVQTQDDIFYLSIKIGFYAGVVIACFWSFFVIIIGSTFKLIFLEFFYHITLLTILGLLVGLLQNIRLQLENFDPDEHRWLLSNEADVKACKLGILPYRQKIKSFWWIMFTLFPISFFGFAFYIIVTTDPSFWASLFTLGMIIFFIVLAIKITTQNYNPIISSREGQIIKLHVPRKGRYNPEQFILLLNDYQYKTDSRTWSCVIDSKKHRLWLSNANLHILAVELLEKKIPTANEVFPSLEELKEEEKSNQGNPNLFWLAGIGMALLSAFVWIFRRKS